jgi:hypothetical protein
VLAIRPSYYLCKLFMTQRLAPYAIKTAERKQHPARKQVHGTVHAAVLFRGFDLVLVFSSCFAANSLATSFCSFSASTR